MLFMAIAYCNPVNGKVCKSRSEIRSWLSDNPAFFIHQVSHVEPDMFSDNEKMKKWPHSVRPIKDYYPTIVSQGSIDFGTI